MLTDRNEVFVVHTPEFRFSIEESNGYSFIHQDVYVWSKATKYYTQRIIDHLEKTRKLSVFVKHDNRKLIKYSSLYGFKYTHKLTSPADGEEYLILERE